MEFNPKRIVSLHNHGCFSVLDGLSRYEDIVKLAVERGQSAAAITEHGNISGIIEFYRRCKEADIKPILGQEFYICPEGRKLTDRDPELDRRRHHITILAKNNEGYKNLCKLSSIAKIQGDYYKPRIDLPTLFKHKEGLIVMSGCAVSQLNFYVESYLGNNDRPDPNGLEKARNYLKKMKEELGDDFYVEQVWLRPTGLDNPYDKKKAEEAGKEYLSIIDRQNLMNEQTTILAKELGIKRVMTGDAHYAYPKDKESHETLLCIGTMSDKNDPSRLTFVDQDLSIPSAEAMYNRAKELNDFELVESQGEIIDKVDLELTLGEYHVPKFPIPKGIIMEGKEIDTEAQYLRYLTFKGYKEKHYEEKWKHKKAEVIAEIKKELSVIDKMGFNGYFLIVQEYVNWARANGILVGPGRGSAAGSVVVYLIGITSIDPMEYPDLMIFERFLNPDRYSMPDIDMDFSDRQKVEDHLVELYGRENVCAIQTVSRMRAKQAFKDVARTEKYDYIESNKVAGLIPDLAGEAAKTNRLANEVAENKDLRSEISQHPELKSIFDTAITLEGTVRGFGVHAAGVIISDKPLNEYVGTYLSKDNRIVQQSDSTDVESAYGLLKMDLLGLQNLSIMDECIQSVKKNYGIDLGVPDDFPLDDEATYDMIGRGESKFTFQFNSVLMRNSAIRLHPRSIKDLALLVAVVRPGPLQFLEEIIAAKNGKRFTGKKRKVIDGKEVEYYPIETTEPKIKAIVDPTYGHVVYQEQLMNICTTCCGFTMGEADKVRKAMGKSKPSELAKYRPHFIQGFLENTDSTKELEISIFWDELLELAKYCFNGSHSICYSTIGYQTAYLLTHYPEEYLAAYLNAKKDDKDAIAEVLGFCKEKGIRVSTPDVTHPGLGFIPAKGKIVYGLTAIKGVGTPAERIVEKYNQDGAAKSLEEFLTSMEKKVLNTRVITSLVYSGALDELVPKELAEKEEGFNDFAPRVILIRNLERIIKYRDDYLKVDQKRAKVKVDEKQASLLDYLFSGNELSAREQKKKDSLTYPTLELEVSIKPLTSMEKKRILISLLLKEKDCVGSFISYNPLNLLSQPNPNWYKDFEATSKRIREAGEQKLPYKDKVVKGIVGCLVKVRPTQTKKGQPMAFLEMELLDASDKLHTRTIPMELTVFSENYSKIKREIKEKFFYEMSVMPEQKEDGSGMVRAIATDIEAKNI